MKKTLIFCGLISINQSIAQFEMKKHSINSGGGDSTDSDFSLKASIGQVDASNTITGGAIETVKVLWGERKMSRKLQLKQ